MYLVFDVGGTFVKYACMTGEGEIREKGKFESKRAKETKPEEFIEAIGKVYDEYKEKETIEGIAMDLPGRVDVENGIVYGGGALTYLDKVPVGDLLSKRCDGIRVALENDGKCAALAEVWLGNAKDVQNAVVMVFGTGIGGGVIIERKVYRGNRMIAGELSYMMGNMDRKDMYKMKQLPKCTNLYEAYDCSFFLSATASTAANCVLAAKKLQKNPAEVTGELIYKLAKEGNKDMQELLEDFYFSIAKGCCTLYAILDPDVILIGGGISAEPAFFEGIMRYVNEIKQTDPILNEIRLDVCKYRNDSNLFGALYNFKQKYKEA